jgi:O-glycosyl hydrolase
MAKAGCPLWAVSVQNEPEAPTPWDSCLYSAEEERDFVRDFLGPALERAGLFPSLKIVVWDHNRDAMFERAAVAYSDPEAEKYIWGVGYHWYGDARFEVWPGRVEVNYADRARDQLASIVARLRDRDKRRAKDGKPPEDEKVVAARWKKFDGLTWMAGLPSPQSIETSPRTFPELRSRLGFENVRRVADLRPDKHILFTEGCQELGGRPLSSVMNDWWLGERYAMNIISDMNAGCEGWIDWNLCLDENGGPNHKGNMCVAPIICDTRSNKLAFLSPFWYLGHFSRYIRPGARRVLCASSRDALETTAFVNMDGSLAVVVMNQSNADFTFWLKVAGSGAANVEAPARSITTFLMREDSKEQGERAATPRAAL